MLNRRHIRIKVMQSLYAFRGSESDDLTKDEKFLRHSLNSIEDLYLSTLALLIKLHKKSIDYNSKVKTQLLSQSSKNPSVESFEENKLLHLLTQNTDLLNQIEKRKLDFWELDFEYVDRLFKKIKDSQLYKAYHQLPEKSFHDDKRFVLDMYTEFIAPDDKLYDYFEDKKLTWVDDIPVVNTAIIRILNKLKLSSPNHVLLPKLYKDDEDKEFALTLLKRSLLNSSKFAKEIAEKSKNWDTERLASIDGVLLKMAICEFQKFPSIPYKVTINEYLEIAKEYSTPKSSIFINGILDRIVKEYKANNLYPKVGRGLM